MSAHTPGPWFHSATSMWGCVTTRSDGYGHVVAEVGSPTTGFGSLDPVRVAETQANGDLIAAAPDLLEVLKRVLMWAPRSTEAACEQDFASARAAIAKAEGRA